jgi:hypothetical protein
MDTVDINLNERAIIYNNALERCMFSANSEASEKHLWEGLNFLIRHYPDDDNINATGGVKHFHAYTRIMQK